MEILTVKGKGSKVRAVPFGKWAGKSYSATSMARARLSRVEPVLLYLSTARAGVDAAGILKLIRGHALAAGVEKR
jgi:site-specific recombinase XerD